jgi:hypothetical protein
MSTFEGLPPELAFALGEGEPFRDFWEVHLPEISGKAANPDGWVSVHCPLHPDRHPSAGVNVVSGVYHCFVCGSLSPYRYLVEVEGYSSDEAATELDQYRETSQSLIPKLDNWGSAITSPREFTRYAELARSRLSPDLPIVREYLESRGLEYQTLVDFGVGYTPANYTPGQVECLVFPYYYGDRVIALRGRDILGRKGGVKGSKMNIYHVNALDGHSRCILVEGETDCLRVHQALKNHGVDIPVVAAPTAAFNLMWAREFQEIEQIIIIPQDDEPSRKRFLPQALEALGPERCYPLLLPWSRYQVGKDVTDWLRYHDEKDLIDRLPRAQRSRRKPKTLKDLREITTEGRDWILENLIARGEIGLIVGAPKKKKSFLALSLAHAIITSSTLGPWKAPKPGKVLFIEEEEGEHSWATRVTKIFEEVEGDSFLCYHQARIRLDDPLWLDRVRRDLGDWRPDLIVFDPLINLHARDENSAQEMIEIWRSVEMYRDLFDAAVLVLVHSSKSPTPKDLWSSIRGSSVMGGKADLALFIIKSEGAEMKVRVDGKSIGEEGVVSLTFDSATLRFHSGLTLHLHGKKDSSEELVLRKIREAGPSGITFSELLAETGLSGDTITRVVRLHASEIDVSGRGKVGDPKIYTWRALPDA